MTNPYNCDIALVDDDSDDQFFFKEAYSEVQAPCHLKTFNNGKEFIEYLLKKEGMFPKVVFLDLNMPIMNGLSCLQFLRNEQRLKEIPVVMFSTSESQEDIKNTFESGANFYLKKPDNFMSLKNQIKKVIDFDFSKLDAGSSQEEFVLC